MKKSILITLLTILPLLAMAQFGQVRGTNASNSNGNYVGDKDNRLTLGVHFTGDAYSYVAGFGAGLLLNIGKSTDLINVTVGAQYIENLAADPRPAEERSNVGLVDGGGQLVIPAAVKLLLIRTSQWNKVYIGCGGEVGFRMHESNILKDFYPEQHPMCKKSVAIVPMLGCRSGHVDFGIYCKLYIDKHYNNSLNGKNDLGKSDKRIGCHLSWFF